ncbi:alpha/beta hydrolase [Arthrobacter ginkgonis]|uniref:Alpha/beta hydrolase n=1 Tax=Arthrobacter ginkgonis TaxID=1630594 RepID=A0ABP7D067_9MICC
MPAALSVAVHRRDADFVGRGQPPVVLIHGFASSAAEDFHATGWTAGLAAAGVASHAVDLPGHGSAGPIGVDGGCSVPALIARLSAIVDGAAASSGCGAVDVIGYSLGARLAWELPGAGSPVRRMVLGGLSPVEPFAALDPGAVAAAVADPGAAADPLVSMLASMVSAPGRDSESLIRLMAALGERPFSPQAGRPAVPLLAVAGSGDPVAGDAGWVAESVPGARVLSVPGDHRGALLAPEFREAAIAFLAS